MKILYVTLENLCLQKGSVVHIKEAVAGLRGRGYNVRLVARGGEGEDTVLDCDNICGSFPLWNMGSLPGLFLCSIMLFFRLWKLIPNQDLVYARDYHASLIAFLPSRVFHKPLVYEVNGLAGEEYALRGRGFLILLMTRLIQLGEAAAAWCADKIVSVTPRIGNYLVQRYGASPEKVVVAGNGVNPALFYPMEEHGTELSTWRKRLGFRRGIPVVGFVGNLARWQGVHVLVDAISDLLDRGELVRGLIVGDGPLREALLKRVRDRGKTNEFLFTGMVPYMEVPFLINLCDLCVAPFIGRRNAETGVSPLKIFEYMACGKAVVASRIDGMEFIEEEGAGILVDPESKGELAEAIADLIRDVDKRWRMGKRGEEISRKRFTWDQQIEHVDALIRRLSS